MNGTLIKQLPHEPRKPVEIERLPGDVLYIEGVKYAGDFFRTLSHPNPKYLYAIRRDGDQVILTAIHNAGEATGFFFVQEYGQGDPAPTRSESEVDNAI